ncbi:hypothetical protein HAX54_044871 [Datura stramonium]|uniref:Uncharacterized protein n=1 Tax=Datura stramonium TaxID=4076 RepID=A0ABS8RP83_DATST|nr:hypothetical protein [Datura stramonium]
MRDRKEKEKAINNGRVGCRLPLFQYKTHLFPLPISFKLLPHFTLSLSLSTRNPSFLRHPPPLHLRLSLHPLTEEKQPYNSRESFEFSIEGTTVASSPTVSNPDANSINSRESKRKKRRKIGDAGEIEPLTSLDQSRETADRVLAVTAKGRSRWSRAILTGRLSHRRLSQINKKHKKAKLNSGNIKSKKPAAKKRLPALQRKSSCSRPFSSRLSKLLSRTF